MAFSIALDGEPALGWAAELEGLFETNRQATERPVPAALPEHQGDRFAWVRNHPELVGPAAQARQARASAVIGG